MQPNYPPTISPSQITLFLNEPALWLLRKRFNLKSEAGPGAWLGDAVNKGVELALIHNAADDDILAHANKAFEERAQGVIDDKTDEARAKIPKMLQQAITALRPFGPPVSSEGWVECDVRGTPYKLRGRTDFRYANRVIDLKTGRNCYTKPQPDHIIQLACYWKATGLPQFLLYVTTSKSGLVEVSEADLRMGWQQVLAAAQAMALSEDRLDAFAFYPPRDLSGYRWDDATRAKAKEVWKLS